VTGEIEDDGLVAIACALLRERAGLFFPPGRHPFARAAIRRAMDRSKIADPADYLAALRSDPPCFDALVAEATVGETYFFRHAEQFEWIRRDILPAFRRAASGGGILRVWSAGCASGEEAYSLAMLLEQEGFGPRSVILGSDISRPLLQKARDGRYTAWSLRGAGREQAGAYLERAGNGQRLVERIRRRVVFRPVNLLGDPYPAEILDAGGADLILCRNVLIYFDSETIARIAERLFGALAVDGCLITGPSDPPLAHRPPIEAVATPCGIAYRRRRAATPAVQGPQARDRSLAPPGTAPPIAAARRRPPEAGRDRRAPPRAAPSAAASAEDFPQRIHALSRAGDVAGAEAVARDATRAEPLRPEGHFLHALLLMELGRYEEALVAARRVIYLDPRLAFGHMTVGTILLRLGRSDDARRSFRNGRSELLQLPPDAAVALSEGEMTKTLVASSEACLAALGEGMPQ
jgi:chemotaxis protein methyltransferase CheR